MKTMRAKRWAVLPALAAVAVLAGAASPQDGYRAPARYPFGAGERAEYQVKLGAVSVGSGSIEVVGTETVGGQSTFHTRMRVSGGFGPARVNDRYESWIDTDGLFSRRFRQQIQEVRYRRDRTYDFFPERMSWRRENGDTGTLASDRPLDDLSFMYYVRTLPLEVGDEYTLNRYFKESGNPVVVRVVRKETVRVPAGTYRTIVVQPAIKTDGIFGEGGRAEIYFSDDRHRIPVLIRSRVPVVGSLTMSLRSFRPSS
jgi:uncharacterized protein DUF3108